MHPLDETVVGRSATSATSNACDTAELASEAEPTGVMVEPPTLGVVPPPVLVLIPPPVIVDPPVPVVPPPLPSLVVIPDPTTEATKKRLGPQEWIVARWQEIPCWLSSLVLHLFVMVLMGSLVLPVSKTVHKKILTFVFVDTPNETELDALQPLDAMKTTSIKVTPSAVEKLIDTTQKLEVAVHPPTIVRAPQPEPPSSLSASTTIGNAANQVTPQPTDFGKQIARTDPLPGPLTGSDIIAGAKTISNQPNEVDEIVDRFIEFDIGQLQGDEGARARRRFEELDYKAIPALVRGLNKSAYIQASCPVMVIEAKLYNELRKSRDPNLVHFALDNLGRGIPASAPHVQRLVRLREQIRSEFMDRTRLREELAKRGLPNNESFIDRLEEARKQSLPNFIESLKNKNHESRLAALVEAQGRSWSGIPPAPRMQIASELIENLGVIDSRTARESHKALKNLTTDKSLITPPADDDDAATKIRLWRAYWDDFRKRTLDRQAESVLRMANNLYAAENLEGAGKYFQRVTDEFPGTPAAKTAKESMAKLSEQNSGKKVRGASAKED